MGSVAFVQMGLHRIENHDIAAPAPIFFIRLFKDFNYESFYFLNTKFKL